MEINYICDFSLGFAVLTKTSALFLILFCGLTVLIHVFRNGKYCFKNKSGTKNLWKNLGEFLKTFGKIFLPWFGVLLWCFYTLAGNVGNSFTGFINFVYRNK